MLVAILAAVAQRLAELAGPPPAMRRAVRCRPAPRSPPGSPLHAHQPLRARAEEDGVALAHREQRAGEGSRSRSATSQATGSMRRPRRDVHGTRDHDLVEAARADRRRARADALDIGIRAAVADLDRAAHGRPTARAARGCTAGPAAADADVPHVALAVAPVRRARAGAARRRGSPATRSPAQRRREGEATDEVRDARTRAFPGQAARRARAHRSAVWPNRSGARTRSGGPHSRCRPGSDGRPAAPNRSAAPCRRPRIPAADRSQRRGRSESMAAGCRTRRRFDPRPDPVRPATARHVTG